MKIIDTRFPVSPAQDQIKHQQDTINTLLKQNEALEAALKAADACAMRFGKLYEIEILRQGSKIDLANLKRYPDLWQCIWRNFARATSRYTGPSDDYATLFEGK